MEIREDLQQPKNALATLLSLIQSARAIKRLMTAPRGKTYFNERPRGRGGEFLARKIGEVDKAKERENRDRRRE